MQKPPTTILSKMLVSQGAWRIHTDQIDKPINVHSAIGDFIKVILGDLPKLPGLEVELIAESSLQNGKGRAAKLHQQRMTVIEHKV